MTIEELDNEYEAQDSEAELDEETESDFESEGTEEAGDVDRADLLKLYLREASRAPMLNAAGEVAAARRIERARTRMMKLLSRSPVIVEYSLHLKDILQRGDENAADIIERIAGVNPNEFNSAAESADAALWQIEAAYDELLALDTTTSKRRGTGKAARVSKKFARSRRIRAQVQLSRAIRAILFTPAAERRLIGLIETAAGIAPAIDLKAQPAGNSNRIGQPTASRNEFDVEASVLKAIRTDLATSSDFVRLAHRAGAAFAEMCAAKQQMTESNLRLVIS